MHATFSLATWNVLATSYIRRELYPNTSPDVLDPRWRVPALVQRARELNVDILCLQEVEADTFAALEAGLKPAGYVGSLVQKGAGRPDGCATFCHRQSCRVLNERHLIYTDGNGGPDSGHIAQVMALVVGGLRMVLVNTHLKWTVPGTPRDNQWAYRQALQALAALPTRAETSVQMVCGDFNVISSSPVVKLFTAAGFDHTHHEGLGVFTCNSSRQPKLIDYIFFRGPVQADPVALPVIERDTPMPSYDQPSDHLPLISNFVTI